MSMSRVSKGTGSHPTGLSNFHTASFTHVPTRLPASSFRFALWTLESYIRIRHAGSPGGVTGRMKAGPLTFPITFAAAAVHAQPT